MRGLLHGLKPERLTGGVVRVFPGSAAVSGTANVVDFPDSMVLEIGRVGVFGRDSPLPPSDGEGWHIYLLRTIADPTVVGAVLSRSITNSGVTMPPGWQLVRKLPFGFRYSSKWGGVPAWHISTWPLPIVLLTFAGSNAVYEIFSGSSAAFVSASVEPWVPDNARCIEALVTVEGAGTCIVRTTGTGQILLPGTTRVLTRVSSSLDFAWRTTGSARAKAHLLGYHQSETPG